MVESPRWLVRRERYNDSLDLLRRLYPAGFDVSDVLRNIKDDIEREKDIQQLDGWDFLLHPAPIVWRMLVVGLGIAIAHEICGIDAIQYYLVFILQALGITNEVQQAKFFDCTSFSKAVLSICLDFVSWLCRATAAYDFEHIRHEWEYPIKISLFVMQIEE